MKLNIGSLAEKCITEGLTNAQTLAIVKFVFPVSGTNLRCISWYRSELSRKMADRRAA